MLYIRTLSSTWNPLNGKPPERMLTRVANIAPNDPIKVRRIGYSGQWIILNEGAGDPRAALGDAEILSRNGGCTWGRGPWGPVMNFDGTSGYLKTTMVYPPASHFSGAFTLMLRLRMNAWNATYDFPISGDNSNAMRWGIQLTSAGRLYFIANTTGGKNVYTADGTIQLGVWYHILCSTAYSDATTWIYINGVPVPWTKTSTLAQPGATAGSVYLGGRCYISGTPYYSNCSISEAWWTNLYVTPGLASELFVHPYGTPTAPRIIIEPSELSLPAVEPAVSFAALQGASSVYQPGVTA